MRVRVGCPNATFSLEAGTTKLQTGTTRVLTAPQHRLVERALLRYNDSNAAKAVMSQTVSRAPASTMEC